MASAWGGIRSTGLGRRCVSCACCSSARLTRQILLSPHSPRQGFGWAIAKKLAEAGAEISLGVWVPALNIFESNYRRGKFDENRKLANGGLLEFAHIYPMDAVFDTPEDVPADVRFGRDFLWD